MTKTRLHEGTRRLLSTLWIGTFFCCCFRQCVGVYSACRRIPEHIFKEKILIRRDSHVFRVAKNSLRGLFTSRSASFGEVITMHKVFFFLKDIWHR